ncbi:hypothetical protein L1987_28612 [Smallanthus sonchifolius]|uniref:Uncharacterized protein n=1 Tax=Smallanthus sonchifolius TaxID=185202 RepID=A0ACB9HYX8_9ASTR|nr:hypothetical protein L1987_28612 [Smallanthus sonchifolius]
MLIDVSMGVVTPLSEQLTKPLSNAMALLVVSVCGDEAYRIKNLNLRGALLVLCSMTVSVLAHLDSIHDDVAPVFKEVVIKDKRGCLTSAEPLSVVT